MLSLLSLLQFDDFARQVIEVTQINAQNIFERYQTMGRQLTAYALATNSTWPFVQMPMFEAQVSAAVEATDAGFVLFTPVVQEAEVIDFELFASSNRQWMQESIDFYGLDTDVNTLPFRPKLYSVAANKTLDDRNLTFHLPVAQVSTVHMYSFFVNGDTTLDQNVDVAFSIMNETRNAVMSGLRVPEQGSLSPGSFLATPVFQSFEDDAPIVAIFSGYLRWQRNFENLLPPDSEPLILEVWNCEDSLSFEINGPEVKYLGPGGGFHDRFYDNLERTGTFTPYLSSTGCDFTLHVFPTADFEAAYRTRAPAIKTVAIISCFFLTAILFIMYNIVVEYRQKKLLSNATKNTALVNSLFPETVRDRLVNEYRDLEKPQNDPETYDPSTPAHIAVASRPPIADRFDCATVFFADLVGCKLRSSSYCCCTDLTNHATSSKLPVGARNENLRKY